MWFWKTRQIKILSVELFVQFLSKQNLLRWLTWSRKQYLLSRIDFNMKRHPKILKKALPCNRFSNWGELSPELYNYLEFSTKNKNNCLWQNIRRKHGNAEPMKQFNELDDSSIKEIKLPMIWKHALNDTSKAVGIFPSKMAEYIKQSLPNLIFSRPNVTQSKSSISAD